MVISGGSAGGYTTLAALVFHDVFLVRSDYGVSDIAALARDTHKFESHYLDWLIGPYPQDEALYRERSPLFHAECLSRPVIFFQGDEDPVVPPNQTEAMVEALRRRGTPVAATGAITGPRLFMVQARIYDSILAGQFIKSGRSCGQRRCHGRGKLAAEPWPRSV